MVKIMFVCTGNICRSAMAHVMLENLAKEKKKDIEVYSCGIYAENGAHSTRQAIDVMKYDYDIDLTKHRATNIRNSNIEEMDYILCATFTHKIMIIGMYPKLKEKVFTMKEFVSDGSSNDLDLKDPWGYDIEIYRSCAKEIYEIVNKIIDKV